MNWKNGANKFSGARHFSPRQKLTRTRIMLILAQAKTLPRIMMIFAPMQKLTSYGPWPCYIHVEIVDLGHHMQVG